MMISSVIIDFIIKFVKIQENNLVRLAHRFAALDCCACMADRKVLSFEMKNEIKKRVCVLYTGGTIGMVPTERGYAPKRKYFSGLLEEISQLKNQDMPNWDVVEFDPLLDSANVAVEQWVNIGREIRDRYHMYDGFVVLHGTDTMAYTASALSFMLEGLGKPVILTGSQIPLCELRSDGRDNLINSMVIAAEGRVNEVCLYFAGKLLRGNRSTKVSSDELMAFASPNYSVLADVGIDIKYNQQALVMPPQASEFKLTELRQVPIGVLKLFPGIQFELFEQIVSEKLSGVVLETFGEGNIPSNNRTLVSSIRRAAENGAIVSVCSQCYRGTTKLGIYATSNALKESGAVGCNDMTTEAAVTKLYYLFSCGYPKETIKKLMTTNLRGEISV